MYIEQQLILTADQFERLDPYEAFVSFDILRQLPEPLILWVWGARIDLEINGVNRCHYIKDYVPLVFSGVEAFNVEMLLYGQRGTFINDNQGDIVRLKRAWGQKDSTEAHNYAFESGCIWPFSRCEFSVNCYGPVSIDLRGARLIADPTPTELEDPPELRNNERAIKP